MQELENIKLVTLSDLVSPRFQGSDDDIRFYTGLPSYNILLCLYHYFKTFSYLSPLSSK